MDQYAAQKARPMVPVTVIATATATPLPVFPLGPTAGVMAFKGDFRGASIAGFSWDMSILTTFTAGDLTIQTSEDGATWRTLKAFSQKTGIGATYLPLLDTDPKPLRYIRGLFDMTGTPGTSSHALVVHYSQVSAPGSLAYAGTADGNE